MEYTYFIITLLGAGLGAAIGGYLSQRGKNLADKQDIEAITKKIESVKSEFTKQNEEIRSFYASKHIAAEKRLDKLQEAYTLSVKLFHNVHDEQCHDVVMKAQEWIYENALFLTPISREAFLKSFRAAADHQGLLQTLPRNKELEIRIKKNFSHIESAPKIIAEEADLPSFSSSYSPVLDPVDSEKKTN